MEEKKSERMSYSQLENVAKQLSEQNRQLYQKLQEANISNTLARLNYLFKVVEFQENFSKEFSLKCKNEIEDILTIKEEVEEVETE